MNKEEKQAYLEGYKQAKKKGVPFFPDVIFKDAVVSLLIFVVLVGLAYFIGAALEPQANPADTSYTPRPEWYFLFLFQLLKYFPGQLEVIGVFVIPTLAVILLFALPFLDRSARRHPATRPVVIGITGVALLGVILLTVQSAREAPPPAEAAGGDQTAALYVDNCAPCHGPSVEVPTGFNLHDVIAQGRHDEGMPAWSADLTTNEIDALAGFIVSPEGSQLFTEQCGACHEAPELVAGDPLELQSVLALGPDYPAHSQVDVPFWSQTLDNVERTALLNFLIAPDGQRLFAINCTPCHGVSVSFSGEPDELRTIIAQGGLHLEMPPWRDRLNDDQLTILASYVVDPAATPEGEALFGQLCSGCHGQRVPSAENVDQAREIIASGGSHETMPVWGDVLTAQQIDALVSYTIESARGTPLEVGQELFSQYCSPCHGDFGEGGPNPSRPGDVIAPLSSAEYLKTRDDFTLRSVISQGQPNFGMSPFGSANGGPLEDDEIDSIVAYMRSWEQNPPVELPPEVAQEALALSGMEVYADICGQCHGPEGEGLIGPSLSSPEFQEENTDQEIFDTINLGHGATAMVAWGEILTQEQIQQLVQVIRQFKPPETNPTQEAEEATPGPAAGGGEPSFSNDVIPIFEARCMTCHGSFGGWSAANYGDVMNTGDNAPVVIPGDAENSLLAQKILGTQEEGSIMPPSGKLNDDEIQVILDWIEAGALDN